MKKDKDDHVKKLLAQVLESNGFYVTILPKKEDVKTADLFVRDPDDAHFFIEIKRKFDDEELLYQREDAFRSNSVFIRGETARGTSTISGLAREASSQVEASQPKEGDFRIIWFVAMGIHEQIQIQQFVSSLYGKENLFCVLKPNDTLPCFYFSFNQFYPLRNTLDGAIVGGLEEGIFYLNNLSPRADALRNSSLYKMFGNAVCDPQKMEASGRAYIADYNGTRNNKFAVLKYVRKKYGKPTLMNFNISHQAVFEAAMGIEPKNGRDASISST